MEHRTTGKVYKVWIEIEEYDIEDGDGETSNAALDIPCSGTFGSVDDAHAFAKDLHALAAGLDQSGAVDHD